MRYLIIGISFTLLIFFSAGCGGPEPSPEPNIIQVIVTATPGPTRTEPATETPQPTPTLTSTATNSPTPTATAPPAVLYGSPREVRFANPVSQTGALCGVVDLLDFPMRPPYGEGTWGGSDFGIYREYYQGLHTGEDWSIFNSRSMGEPVYSIGHGMVTYAQPRGWGRDGGVVIVQHVLPDWTRVLSFYGHLDPPTVNLRAGDCVRRGDTVGDIGDRQHLHFEIRTHMPNQPGPGYWSIDPTLAGWINPSKFIIDQRLGSSPGLVWMQTFDEQNRGGFGMLDSEIYVAYQQRKLVGVDVDTGEVLFMYPVERNYSAGVVETAAVAGDGLIYLTDRHGVLDAYRIPDTAPEEIEAEEALDPVWRLTFPTRGEGKLMLHSDGGVLLSMDGGMWYVSDSGDIFWELEDAPLVFDWTNLGQEIVFSTRDEPVSIWVVDQGESLQVLEGQGGKLVTSGGRVFAYDEYGVYRLDLEEGEAELIIPLPRALPNLGDVVGLDDGGLLLAHTELRDSRLIVLNEDGSMRWQNSFKDQLEGEPSLLELDEKYYLVLLEDGGRFSSRITLVSIDPEDGQLIRLFSDGVRGLVLRTGWVDGVDSELVIVNIEDRMLAIDPEEAQRIVQP